MNSRMKIGLFIDYYDTGEKSRGLLSECLKKFLDCGYDIFLISNNVTSIDIPINKLKYFEYDGENRLFKSDLRAYCLIAQDIYGIVDCEDNTSYHYKGTFGAYNPVDWSLFYNISKAAQVMKTKGYDYMLKIDYDVILKNYDVLNTIFRDLARVKKSKFGMTIESSFWDGSPLGGLLNNFLISVDLISSSIPLNKLATSEGYRDWVHSLPINNVNGYMPIFEVIFSVLFRDKTEIIPYQTLNEELITLDGNTNDTRVFEPPFLNYDNMSTYPILAAYINSSSQLMVLNKMNKKCFFKIRENVFCLEPNCFRLFPGDDETTIETPAGETRITKKEWSHRRISGQLIK